MDLKYRIAKPQKAKHSIDTVIFDLGGVLDQNDIWGQVSKKYLVYNTPKEQFWRDYKVGKIQEKEFWEGVLAGTGDESKQEELARATRQAYANPQVGPAHHIVIPLAERGYRLCLLSNHVTEWAMPTLSSLGVLPYFQATLISSEIKAAKPQREAFEMALEAMGRDWCPERCLFLDDQSKNIQTASSMGINAIQVKDRVHLERDLEKTLGLQLGMPIAYRLGLAAGYI